MRVIQGKLDEPESARILICRGLDQEAYEYFEHHVKAYPQWALVLAIDPYSDISLLTYSDILKGIQTPMHKVIETYDQTDYQLTEWVNTVLFPPYNEEDDDPEDKLIKKETETPTGPDFTGSLKSVSASIDSMAEALGRPHGVPTEIISARSRIPDRFTAAKLISREQLFMYASAKGTFIDSIKMRSARELFNQLIAASVFKSEVIEQPDGSVKVVTYIDVLK